jgi:hypothetical protein
VKGKSTMARTHTVDGRWGLTAEVLERLAQADELFLSCKTSDTGVVGWWLPSSEAGAEPELWTLLVLCQAEPEIGIPTEPRIGRPPSEEGAWQDMVRLLRPGDRMRLEWRAAHVGLLVNRGQHFTFHVLLSLDARRSDAIVHLLVSLGGA